jgi:hypothetical protein
MSIIPHLLDAANTPAHHKLHAKAIACAGPIGLLTISRELSVLYVTHLECSATAIGRKAFERIQGFRRTLNVELLIRIPKKKRIFNSVLVAWLMLAIIEMD